MLDANAHDGAGGDGGEGELAGAFAADLAQAGDVDHAHRDGKDDGAEHAAREVLQRSGQEQQYRQNEGGEHELGELAARPRAVRHGGLGRAAVDDKGAAESGGGVGRGKAEDVGVRIDGFRGSATQGARRGGTLRNDHDEA